MSLLVARRGLLAAGAAPTEEPPPSGDYAAEVAADNPDWWLRLSETSGATAADEVGTNDGTVTGANLDTASFADTGSAASFDGTDDRIDVPHDALLNAGDLFTFECLVKLDDPASDALQVIADKTGLSSSNAQWALRWDNRSSQGSPLRLAFRVYGGNGPPYQANWEGTEARDALASGVHIAGTWDVNAGVSVLLNANGDVVGQSSDQNANSPSANSRDVYIANMAGNFHLGGILDELAIYHKVLSTSRIAAHASAAGLGS